MVNIDRYNLYEQKLFEVIFKCIKRPKTKTVANLWDKAHLHVTCLITVNTSLHRQTPLKTQ